MSVLGVEVQILHASTEGEIDTAFANLSRTRTGAVLVSNEYSFNSRSDQLAALAARTQVRRFTCYQSSL
jgi:putative ABC transport system substrate-binding protein